MPLSDAEAEKIASATWFRDSDPRSATTEAAWIALHNARMDAASALAQISLLRKEFAAFAGKPAVDEKDIVRGLLAALDPQQIAAAVIAALPAQQATEAADSILSRINDAPLAPGTAPDDDRAPAGLEPDPAVAPAQRIS